MRALFQSPGPAIFLLLAACLIQPAGCASRRIAVPGPVQFTSQDTDVSKVVVPQPEGLPNVWESARSEAVRGKRFDDPDGAGRYYLMKRLPPGEDDLPVERYFEAQRSMERMTRYSAALDGVLPAGSEKSQLGVWTPLGPGNIGGRTRAMLYHPLQPEIIYAAGVAGGAWRSTNGGASWAPLADTIASIAVNSLAIDPQNPDVIYAGTGEGYFAIDNVRGAGIFRSSDGGGSWTQLANTSGADFHYVNDLVISRNDNRRIYAATRTGVWRSNDSGNTWSQVYSTTVQGGCTDLAMRTDLPTDYIFAACGNFQQASVVRNEDAAGAGQWVGVLTDSGMGRTAIAIAPSNQNVVYAVSTELSGPYQHALHAFYRSTSGGGIGTWSPRIANTDQNPQNKLGRTMLSVPPSATATDCRYGVTDSFRGQAWYDLAIAVDPLDENRVWVGGIDLFRSDDGGATWGLAGFSYLGSNFALGRTHPDQHVIVFHPGYDGAGNQQMLVGNDGGIYRTDNARAAVATGATAHCNPQVSQVRWESLNNAYEVTQFYHGVVYPDGSGYFGGTQDNGTVRGTNSAGPNAWRMISGADGGYSAIDFLSPNILYASTQNTGFRKSTDDGGTFSSATFGINETGLFITPVAMDPSDPRRLYTGAGSIFRTSDGAAFWNSIGSIRAIAETGGGSISAIAVSPTDANSALIGMGTSDGSIIRTSRLLTLSRLTPPARDREFVTRPRTGWVSWLAFDPTSSDIAYATYSTFGGAHVWRTIDGGISWTAIDGTGADRIPDIPVHCIVVDPTNTARLFVGTDLGVFVSTDGGATWFVENTGFANVVTETLAVNVHNGVVTLYAFTHGRGAYKVVIGMNGCSWRLSRSTVEMGADGGTTGVEVTSDPAGCAWEARSNSAWIKAAAIQGGVEVRVEPNADIFTRAGTVTIGDRSFTVVQSGALDVSLPVVTITSHEESVVPTSEPSIMIGGTATDNSAVSQVAWRTDRGAAGVASGTGTWTASIPLLVGANTITVTATDDAGNRADDVLSVVSTAPAALVTVAGTGMQGYDGDGRPALQSRISRPIRMDFDAAGNLYFADIDNHRIRKVGPDGIITTVAGNGQRGYSGDGGPATLARLDSPLGVAVAGNGDLYIADGSNHVIRRVSGGVITTVAGNGTRGFSGDGGPAVSAQLNLPESVRPDIDGSLLIADSNNHRIRRVRSGTITTIAGNGVAGFGGDGGQAISALITLPTDLALDPAGNILIVATGNNRIRRINRSSGIIETVVGNGGSIHNGDSIPANSAAINNPQSIDFDSAGNLYLVDRGNFRIRRVDAATGLITTLAGGASGFSPDGSPAPGARLNAPTGLAIGPGDVVHFSDRDNSRIRRLLPSLNGDAAPPSVAIQIPAANGANPLTLNGTAADDGNVVLVAWSTDRGKSGAAAGTGAWTAAGISLQKGRNTVTVTAWDAAGNSGSAVIVVDHSPVTSIVTLAGTGASGSSGDGGRASTARLWAPVGIAVDKSGNVVFVDGNNRRVRRVTSDGMIERFAGTGDLGSSGDGGPAVSSTMNAPVGIAIDKSGNVFIADANTHRVRRIDPNGIVTTVAGSGEGFGGYSGDDGPAIAAQLRAPAAVAVDDGGNLFIADRSNHRIRRVDAVTGIITTFAGLGTVGFSGDGGPAIAAELWLPSGLAFDAQGNLFIADQGNQRIRRVAAATGIIETVAGTGRAGFSGDGIPAIEAEISVGFPTGIAADPAGNVCFTDRGNHRVRCIDRQTGLITTVAGIGAQGFSGDGSDPQAAELAFPTGMAIDAAGNLFISDTSNNRIRRTIASASLGSAVAVSAASYSSMLAPESIAAAFGPNLATDLEAAAGLPLPVALAGTSIRIRDNLGVERLSPLFFASPGQINFQIPAGTSNGIAEMTVINNEGRISTGTVRISSVAPGLFTANSTGSGVAAAVLFRRAPDGQESYEPVTVYDQNSNRFIPLPIEIRQNGEVASLILFGTGWRFNGGLPNVRATIDGIDLPVIYAGPTPGLVGLDQFNILLDSALAGRGEVEIILSVDGEISNRVSVSFGAHSGLPILFR